MKKITYVLALLGVLFSSVQSTFAATDSKWADKWIASVGDAVTSLEGLTDGYYVLRNVGRKTFLCENDDNKLYLGMLRMVAMTLPMCEQPLYTKIR